MGWRREGKLHYETRGEKMTSKANEREEVGPSAPGSAALC
jgi:hypothetical protein